MLVLLSTACVHPSVPSSASSSSSSSSTSEPTSTPSIESTTGLESPVSPTHGEVAISMAPAPTGRTGNSGDSGQCIQVSWLGNTIPPGDIVTITSVTIQLPFTFDPAVTAQCGDAPSCLNYRYSAADDNGSGQFCNVGVGYTRGSVDPDGDDSTNGYGELVGYLSCPPDVSSAGCQHDAVAMQSSRGGTIEFNVPVIDNTPPPTSPPPESPSSSPPESPPSSSATSNSSSSAAQGSS